MAPALARLAIAFSILAATACANGAGRPAAATGAHVSAPPATTDSLPAMPEALTSIKPCEPSGKRGSRDYQVGNGPKQLASLDKVPWEDLEAGDTVRIFYRPQAYVGKFAINAHGTAAAPVRVCGVRGPHGERPTITGTGATTRSSMSYGRDSASPTNQSRGIVMIVARGDEYDVTQPEHIQIDGLKLTQAHPKYSFVDSAGHAQPYNEFGACIWIEKGHHVTIADNEITDCSQAIFSRSFDGNAAGLTTDLRIAGNTFSDNGIFDKYTIHTLYIQSVGVTYEFNHFGPMRDGATGNAIKDRSVGAVVRYNRIESGAYAIDLVEAEDFPKYALSDPAYRSTFVYGNQIVKTGDVAIHYGGDHQGNEDNYRKGTLYFYNNTVSMLDSRPADKQDHKVGAAYVFRIATTQETVKAWNNIFMYDDMIEFPALRTTQDVEAPYTQGGIVDLGVNWIDERAKDSDPYHPVPGQLNGLTRSITGASPPVNQKLVPETGSKVIGAGEAGPDAARVHPVLWQLDASMKPVPRSASGARADLGAIQH